MRGFCILSLLLGLLYYGFLNKEAVEESVPLLQSIKFQAKEISERENRRSSIAKNCRNVDEDEVAECLEDSYAAIDEDDSSDIDSDSNYTPKKSKTNSSSRSSKPISKRFPKYSGGSAIQGL